MRRIVLLVIASLACGDSGSGNDDGSSGETGSSSMTATTRPTASTGTASGTDATTASTDTDTSGTDTSGTTGPGLPWDCPPPTPVACDRGNGATPPIFDQAPLLTEISFGGFIAELGRRPYVGDVEGDGDVDILSPSTTGPVLFLNDGVGGLVPAYDEMDTVTQSEPVYADFDGDCVIDLLTRAVDENAELTFWLRRGSANGLQPAQEISIGDIVPTPTTQLAGPFHFDDDAAPDLLVEHMGQGFVALHSGTEDVSFSTGDPLPWPMNDGGGAGELDMDGDGDAAEVGCGPTEPSDDWVGACRIQDGGIVVPQGVTISEGLYVGIEHNLLGDLQGDGTIDRLDLFSNANDLWTWYVSPLDTFTMVYGPPDPAVTFDGHNPVFADVDLDCDADGVGQMLPLGIPSPLRFSYNDGSDTFVEVEDVMPGIRVVPLELADFDADGDLDLLAKVPIIDGGGFAIFPSSLAD